MDLSSFAAIVGLTLIALAAWLVRRFGSKPSGITSSRGRQRRIAVIDPVSVDRRRRLILMRRDNVEHLMMIGGSADIIVEADIVREPMPARDSHAAPTQTETPTLPRPAPLYDGSVGQPLQPEPPPDPQFVPPTQTGPKLQTTAITPAPAAGGEYAEGLTALPSGSPKTAFQRKAASIHYALADLEDELARTAQPQPEPATSGTRPTRREPRMTRPRAEAPPHPLLPAPPTGQPDTLPDDAEVAEMTRRLEAVLRRPAKSD